MKVKRFLDILIASFLMIIFIFPMLIIFVLVMFSSNGPAVFWSNRIGKNKEVFSMPKFRSMKVKTPSIASHLLVNPSSHLTFIGKFLRLTSLDELPQLFLVLSGKMSLVGPRPALYNQLDLIQLRDIKGINNLTPGITGWAQINGRDNLSISEKVELEFEYLNNYSNWLDIKILCLTILKIFHFRSISH
jgi:O-antigen biosynthesis protein WbqP